ncbi:hypothetical protein HYH03_013239 [Edaphochlamys debaryana]|uniref:Protein kinase domain-containing protein n=1 Tax=Edaphochlamys debaryana TaxID=47281 RepID=A0A835XR77_9CHLO|nr:hypothetical protein HYH03_013239 [Edaphochlamys debaryana]|eukprot:KAG2488249.1 hypothetical protein HYH03_013239 [Edaphochlamys debaryana]
MAGAVEDLTPLRQIGEGSFATVFEALHRPTGLVVVVKRFKDLHMDPEVRRLALRELRVLASLPPHPSIVQLLRSFRSNSGRLYLAFEQSGRDLKKEMARYPGRRLPPALLRAVAWQLLGALEHCHSHGVIHRDVKPSNVLIDTREGDGGEPAPVVKLCDFGLARWLPGAEPDPMSASRGLTGADCAARETRDQGRAGACTDYVGTRWYRAPEILVGNNQYGTAVDLWALGCTLAEAATGKPLFPGSSETDQMWHIARVLGPVPYGIRRACSPGSSQPPARQGPRSGASCNETALGQGPVEALGPMLGPLVDPGLLQVIGRCLAMDPALRPTAAQLRSLPYFHGLREPPPQRPARLPEPPAEPQPSLYMSQHTAPALAFHPVNVSGRLREAVVARAVCTEAVLVAPAAERAAYVTASAARVAAQLSRSLSCAARGPSSPSAGAPGSSVPSPTSSVEKNAGGGGSGGSSGVAAGTAGSAERDGRMLSRALAGVGSGLGAGSGSGFGTGSGFGAGLQQQQQAGLRKSLRQRAQVPAALKLDSPMSEAAVVLTRGVALSATCAVTHCQPLSIGTLSSTLSAVTASSYHAIGYEVFASAQALGPLGPASPATSSEAHAGPLSPACSAPLLFTSPHPPPPESVLQSAATAPVAIMPPLVGMRAQARTDDGLPRRSEGGWGSPGKASRFSTAQAPPKSNSLADSEPAPESSGPLLPAASGGMFVRASAPGTLLSSARLPVAVLSPVQVPGPATGLSPSALRRHSLIAAGGLEGTAAAGGVAHSPSLHGAPCRSGGSAFFSPGPGSSDSSLPLLQKRQAAAGPSPTAAAGSPTARSPGGLRAAFAAPDLDLLPAIPSPCATSAATPSPSCAGVPVVQLPGAPPANPRACSVSALQVEEALSRLHGPSTTTHPFLIEAAGGAAGDDGCGIEDDDSVELGRSAVGSPRCCSSPALVTADRATVAAAAAAAAADSSSGGGASRGGGRPLLASGARPRSLLPSLAALMALEDDAAVRQDSARPWPAVSLASWAAPKVAADALGPSGSDGSDSGGGGDGSGSGSGSGGESGSQPAQAKAAADQSGGEAAGQSARLTFKAPPPPPAAAGGGSAAGNGKGFGSSAASVLPALRTPSGENGGGGGSLAPASATKAGTCSGAGEVKGEQSRAPLPAAKGFSKGAMRAFAQKVKKAFAGAR